jgi:adenylosuccinate synthase
MVNGFDSLILTKLDVLDDLDEIPVCVAYRDTDDMPATNGAMQRVQPVYERLPGWKRNTRGLSTLSDLPPAARDYVAFLEERSGVEVGCVSTGPERNETLVLPGTRMAKLLAR